MPRHKSTGLPPAEEERLRTNELLEIAGQVFLEQGYQAASTTQIAKRANASKQTFYMRFPTKKELFLAFLDYRTAKFADRFSLIFRKNDPIRQVLAETAHTLLSEVLSRENIALVRIVYMEAPQFPEAAKLFIERGPDRTIRALADYLSSQTQLTSLHKDPFLAAQQLAGLVVGDLVHRALLGLKSTKLKNAWQTRAETSVDAFLKIYASS